MKRTAFFLALLVLGALGCHSGSGDCVAAGGSCRIGTCPIGATDLAYDCNNGNITPGGQSCCAPCPKGTVLDPRTGGACVSVDASADAADASTDACAPSGCTGSCVDLSARNVSAIVNGCVVWQCCVLADAGAASSDAAE
jgi:hypothetical protein